MLYFNDYLSLICRNDSRIQDGTEERGHETSLNAKDCITIINMYMYFWMFC